MDRRRGEEQLKAAREPEIPDRSLPRSLRTRFHQLEKFRYREKHNEILLEGARIVADAVTAGVKIRAIVFSNEAAARMKVAREEYERDGIPVHVVPDKEFSSLADTRHAQGIAAVAVRPMPLASAGLERHLAEGDIIPVFDSIADPGNLGAILRTCDWFGVPLVLLSAGSTDPYNPKTIRASMGSIFRTQFHRFDDFTAIARMAAEHGYVICAAEPDGAPVGERKDLPRRIMLLFGNEAHGLSGEYDPSVQLRLAIPRYGRAESLNVSIACAVLLAEFRGRGYSPPTDHTVSPGNG